MAEKLINIPKILDERGNLSFLENSAHFPFEIKRVFWTYDVPGGEIRGGHAYKTQHEVIIALSGSFDVVVKNTDGSVQKYQLNRSYKGLHLPPLCWRHMENFSTNAVSLHLSSGAFDLEEYIRDEEKFLNHLDNG